MCRKYVYNCEDGECCTFESDTWMSENPYCPNCGRDKETKLVQGVTEDDHA